jgi:hypothetical protein
MTTPEDLATVAETVYSGGPIWPGLRLKHGARFSSDAGKQELQAYLPVYCGHPRPGCRRR